MNPVLVNDLRKSLFRRKPVLATAYTALAILALIYVVALVPNLSFWHLYEFPLWRFPDLLLPIVAPAFAAGSFAKEHEQRTWQDVLLTRLTGGEILRGKFFSCYLPTLVSLVVMFPAFCLLLIIQGVEWAMNPGPWMLLLGLKVLIAVTFYVALSLVVSYHSPNGRVALAVTYGVLATYGLLNYMAWSYVIEPLLAMNNGPANSYIGQSGWNPSSYEARNLVLPPVEWLVLLQGAFLGAAMLLYLAIRLRERRE